MFTETKEVNYFMFDFQVVSDTARISRCLSRRSLRHPVCACDRICWTQRSRFCWDFSMDILHVITHGSEWISLWDSELENFVSCHFSSCISLADILEVSHKKVLLLFSIKSFHVQSLLCKLGRGLMFHMCNCSIVLVNIW